MSFRERIPGNSVKRTGFHFNRTFHADSFPYLVPTEYPWTVLHTQILEGMRILTIAGSGEIPLFMAAENPASLVAVDLSQRACFLTELKRAAYLLLDREAFGRFFFEGLPSYGQGPFCDHEGAVGWRFRCYRKLRTRLSPEARDFFDSLLSPFSEGNPFLSFLRPTDRLHVDSMPSLRDGAAYERWKRGAERNFPIICLAVEEYLEKASPESLDFVYLSNVLEYVRSDFLSSGDEEGYRRHLETFGKRLDRVLGPGGIVGIYLFLGRMRRAFREMVNELAFHFLPGYKKSFAPVLVRPKRLSGTVWRPTVVLFRKSKEE